MSSGIRNPRFAGWRNSNGGAICSWSVSRSSSSWHISLTRSFGLRRSHPLTRPRNSRSISMISRYVSRFDRTTLRDSESVNFRLFRFESAEHRSRSALGPSTPKNPPCIVSLANSMASSTAFKTMISIASSGTSFHLLEIDNTAVERLCNDGSMLLLVSPNFTRVASLYFRSITMYGRIIFYFNV